MNDHDTIFPEWVDAGAAALGTDFVDPLAVEAVIAAVEPLIRADERERIFGLSDSGYLYEALAHALTRAEDVAAALTALGVAYRGYWGDFDGRTLRGELDELVGALRGGEFNLDEWWANSGICRVCGQWVHAICDGHESQGEQS